MWVIFTFEIFQNNVYIFPFIANLHSILISEGIPDAGPQFK